MPENNVEHVDCLGRKLKIGDCVAFSYSNHLCIGIIGKLNPKMVKVKELGKKSNWTGSYNKFPQDVVILEGPDITMFLLKIDVNK